MKAHIGADAASGLVHSVAATAGSNADVAPVHELLHGEETMVLGDAGYTGAHNRRDVERRDEMQWCIAERRGRVKKLRAEGSPLAEATERLETVKAQLRAPVEHAFHVINCRFGHRKVRYRGIAKNHAQLYSLFGLANVLLARSWMGAT